MSIYGLEIRDSFGQIIADSRDLVVLQNVVTLGNGGSYSVDMSPNNKLLLIKTLSTKDYGKYFTDENITRSGNVITVTSKRANNRIWLGRS